MTKENQNTQSKPEAQALSAPAGSVPDAPKPNMDQYWKEVGESYRCTAELLRSEGYSASELKDELKRLSTVMVEGLKFYSPNSKVDHK